MKDNCAPLVYPFALWEKLWERYWNTSWLNLCVSPEWALSQIFARNPTLTYPFSLLLMRSCFKSVCSLRGANSDLDHPPLYVVQHKVKCRKLNFSTQCSRYVSRKNFHLDIIHDTALATGKRHINHCLSEKWQEHETNNGNRQIVGINFFACPSVFAFCGICFTLLSFFACYVFFSFTCLFCISWQLIHHV